jgi:hypothetical protein
MIKYRITRNNAQAIRTIKAVVVSIAEELGQKDNKTIHK